MDPHSHAFKLVFGILARLRGAKGCTRTHHVLVSPWDFHQVWTHFRTVWDTLPTIWDFRKVWTCFQEGNIIGVGANLAPMVTFGNIYKKKDSQGFSGLPYVFSLVAALIWVLYGLPSITKHALLIITINVASSTIQIFYLIIFLSFATKKPKRHLVKVMGACFVLLATLAVLTLTVVPQNQRSLTVGSICVVIGVVTSASPPSVGRVVVRTIS